MKILLDNAEGHISIERMKPYWKKMGHTTTTSSFDKPDVQLCYVRIGMRAGLPTVLRIDGIYYDSDTNYNARNGEISFSHSSAKGLIYQSEYSRKMIEKYLSPRRKDSIVSVIYNGIEKGWSGDFTSHEGINISVTSKWRRHKRLQEIIELFFDYQKFVPKSKLHIFGRLHDNKEVKNKNVVYYGHVDRNKMFEVLRQTDFSLHLSKRDSCPNSVVEYIGAGIPVITTNTCGGATEMCRMTQGCIVVNGDGDENDIKPVPHYRDSWNVLTREVRNNIIDNMVLLSQMKVRVSPPEKLTAEYQAEQYIKILEAVK